MDDPDLSRVGHKTKSEPESVMESAEEELINFNVGGWYFSVPKSKVAQFPESLLWKEASVQDQSENLRLFIDQDGFVFRHLHYYMQTSKLPFFSCAELNLLYEQALILQLTPLLQILDNLKEEKYNLHVQPADTPVAERTSLNYWRTQKCTSKPSEIPPNSPAFTGLHERAPLGLVDTPLLDTEDEVNYCFLPLDLVAKYPVLVNDDNLLWLLENAALIECECSEFRFIVNFLRSEKMLLPDDFSNIDALEEEVLILGIPELIDAVKIYRGGCSAGIRGRRGAAAAAGGSPPRSPLYAMALGLLANYPDSALGQLCVGSDLGRSRLHLSGDGILFQHARNWLGTCRLPLTENISEIKELCAYLDKRDTTYEPMKDALKCYLKQQMPAESGDHNADWTAEVSVCSLHQIVKVYVGSNWYETYLQTLLKYPELLSNDKKVCWITYGQSLLIHGDGQMFRHVLNFLRLGKLFLPAEFKEWPLFCQEAEEYQIPSLLEALYHSDAYRLWIQNNELCNEVSFPCRRLSIVSWNEENEFSKNAREVYSCSAVDSSKCSINTWSNIKDLKGKQETSGAKYSKIISWAKGTKRRNTLQRYDESSASLVNSSYYKRLVSPPRKRGMRSTLTKKVETKDSASHLQKLISLVKEWDTVSSKRCDVQHVRKPDGCIAESVSSAQRNTPEKDRGVKAPIASAPGKISFTIQGNNHITQYEVGAEGKQPEQYVFTQSLPVTPSAGTCQFSTIKTTPVLGNDAENINQGQAEETRDSKQTDVVLANHRNVGLILKVEHPPVLGSDGFCASHEESVVYSALLDGSQLDTPKARALSKDIVFLTFALSHEEMFYARKCHFFLTDVIVDSVRQKDPKEITAKVGTLVNRLWTQQITPREFVADLLNTRYFKGDRNVHEELLQWVEFTLPFAWKYSRCLDLLIQRGLARSVSYFSLEM
ncbi:BTB/POZ domain-containing protein KCTD19 [Gymnogyps californianus]|uniref:BTB/POZ domain-containing protein KCTD19 n=1 Tax=Gymnogyps californianus TaxID=33616 RepID=UPI0021C58167|nr:BTB/POZ domain-containing protein KCTD19 [Gymnogyps californianus]